MKISDKLLKRRAAAFSLFDLRTDANRFLDDVVTGLSRPQKELPPKYFYDARGCKLFDAICRLPEYYLTRAEIALMRRHGRAMARRLGAGCAVVEYGSGSGRKTRILVEAAAPVAYVPIDIAREQLAATAAEFARDYPRLKVIAYCADYSRPLALPQLDALGARRRAIYFPGSTIGNFSVAEAAGFLRGARDVAGRGGALLIGVDLKKDPARLHAAYNDARGVTADFNLNLLARINRELGADFDLSGFRHLAFNNEALGRIEMHLVSLRDQAVTVGGRSLRFRSGETIHTENSYKYSVGEFQELARGAGLAAAEYWTDPERLFAVHYLTVPE